jgi:multidrug efflux system membrane fusion protein
MFCRRLSLLLPAALLAAAGGCERKQAPIDKTETPVVPVSKPLKRSVTDFVDFTGRTDAVEAVDIRARVNGYLVKLAFKEGDIVRGDDRLRGCVRVTGMMAAPLGQGALLAAAGLYPGRCQDGDLLFEIDPGPYKAQLDQAKSQVALNEASLSLATQIYQRDLNINSRTPGAISQYQLDQEKAVMDEATMRVNSARASTEVYRLNFGYTRVTAPIDGQIGRYYLTRGNIVNQDQTLLTTIVSLDPIYAYFDMDEPTLHRIQRGINANRIKRPAEGVPVLMGVQGEEGYPHAGILNFVNNQVNPTTGSISARAVFKNPIPEGGHVRIFRPGMFARIRMQIGEPHDAWLVADKVIQSDQGQKYVYYVDKDNIVQTRYVQTGALQPDGLRVVRWAKPGKEKDEEEKWWKAAEVVTGSLQQIRPKLKIKTEETDMPTLGPRDLEKEN